MALTRADAERSRTVDHLSHDALARIVERVEDIRARREMELLRERLAAQGLSRP